MGSTLPDLGPEVFERRLRDCTSVDFSPEAAARLYEHYRELRRWNPRLSLVGPGTAEFVVERHYGESLAALELIRPGRQRVLDVGSGGGFPGMVLASVRQELEVYLLEPRRRKWAFLRSAARRASLSCVCLNARVDTALPRELPGQVDLSLVRALKLNRLQLEAIGQKMSQGSSLLSWTGSSEPLIPSGFTRGRELALAGPGVGRIVELTKG